ncbi:MAG: hypothetical protein IJ365_07755 [Clostridia bacterium]|nr:hypothetical protein [Clostridia bacterium]
MSKKILSIILTIAVILCQGTLCLGTVYAAEGEGPLIEQEAFELTLDAGSWVKGAGGNVTIYNDEDGALVFNDIGAPNSNPTKDRYDSGWMELRNISVDVTSAYAIEFKAKIERAKGLTRISDPTVVWDPNACRPQFYYQGNPNVGLGESNSTGSNISYTMSKNSDGDYYNDDYVTYRYVFDSSWSQLEVLTFLRLDPLKNGEGTIKIKDLKLISKPGIENVTYNSVNEADLTAMPVNPETIEINFTAGLSSVSSDAVSVVDADGNAVEFKDVKVSGNSVVLTMQKNATLNAFTDYTVTFNENTMITETRSLNEPMKFGFTTSDERVPTIFDLIDPERPDDTIPEGEEVWSLEFKDAADLAYFKSTANVKTEIAYNEYMRYVTPAPVKNANNNWQGFYIDSDFKGNGSEIDANKYYRLQIRMKVVNETWDSSDPYFKMYFNGKKDVGGTLSMAESNANQIDYEFHTDEDGNHCTDWFVIDIDLSTTAWKEAATIEQIRFDIMKNAEGEALVDYIRLIAYPAVTEITYTDDEGTAPITDEVYVPADVKNITLQLSQRIPEQLSYSLVNEYGSVAVISDADSGFDKNTNTINVAIEGGLDTSSTYKLTIESTSDLKDKAENPDVLSARQDLYKPIEVTFKTELDPITTQIDKGHTGASINYINDTNKDVVLVAIATVWNGNQYVGKAMAATEVAANSTVENVSLDYSAYSGTVELVIWRYDVANDSYSVMSKAVY